MDSVDGIWLGYGHVHLGSISATTLYYHAVSVYHILYRYDGVFSLVAKLTLDRLDWSCLLTRVLRLFNSANYGGNSESHRQDLCAGSSWLAGSGSTLRVDS
jgi:hypothetical protein